MKTLLLRLLLVCAGMAGAFVAPANATVEININRGNVQPLPIAITEWGVTGWDDIRFIRRMFKWINHQPRVRMLVYYRGFGEDAYYPYNYPRSLKVIRNKLKNPRYLEYARGYARQR